MIISSEKYKNGDGTTEFVFIDEGANIPIKSVTAGKGTVSENWFQLRILKP